MSRPNKTCATLYSEFLSLLAAHEPEQRYQEFLEENSRLIPCEFVQNHGIHFGLVLRKLSLAKDYTTDFFYLAKSSADWNCVLIEIEKPYSQIFKSGSNDFHQDFQTGLDQISRWRAWFKSSANFEGFVNGTIKSIRIPAVLTSNPCYIKYVLGAGRRQEFDSNETRRNLLLAQEREDFHILSYDSLLENLHGKSELYVGVRRNEWIEIISKRFAGEDLFSRMPPEQLRISRELREDVEAHRDEWFHYNTHNELLLDKALPRIALTNGTV